MDEHPDSINDGAFFNAQRNAEWIGCSSLHNNACGFAFADGHSEIHRWRGSVAKYPVKLVDWSRTPSLQDPGFSWLLERTSYR
jgi:prepilin-type processing-associated H-X9-DG protein